MSLKTDHYWHISLLWEWKPLNLRLVANGTWRELSSWRDGHATFLFLLQLQHHHHLLLLLQN